MRRFVLATFVILFCGLLAVLALFGPWAKPHGVGAESQPEPTASQREEPSALVEPREGSRTPPAAEPAPGVVETRVEIPSAAIAGSVRVLGAPPREPVSLKLLAAKDSPSQEERIATAGADGRFAFEGLAPGFKGQIQVPRRYRFAGTQPSSRTLDVEAPSERLVLELERRRCLTGRLVSRLDGAPVEGASLRVRTTWPDGGQSSSSADLEAHGRFFLTLNDREFQRIALEARTETGLQGTFQFERDENSARPRRR